MINVSLINAGPTLHKAGRANIHGFSALNRASGVTLILSDSSASGVTGSPLVWMYIEPNQSLNEDFIKPIDCITGLRSEILGGGSGCSICLRWS